MAEFEPLRDNTAPSEWALDDGRALPADFTADEAETAQWLNAHFDIIGENLPPYYAQTLLGDPRHAPAGEDFEARMVASVFTRLELERPATPAAPPVIRRWRSQARHLVQRVAQRGTIAVMALLMLLSYNAFGTGVAMASVLQLISGHGGAQAVVGYPRHVTPGGPGTATTGSDVVTFIPRWPGSQIQGYAFSGMNIVTGQWWTEGAVVILHYTASPGIAVQHLDILEFVPHVRVAMQLVQDGWMSSVKIGDAPGVFVWGHWAYHPDQGMVWMPGQRAELIYGGAYSSDPVIWIAADALDDQSADQMQGMLMDVAGSLQLMRPLGMQFNASDAPAFPITQVSDIGLPFRDDVIALVPDQSNPEAPVVDVRVGTNPPDNPSPATAGTSRQ
jgi:hypothetical protein